MIVSRSVYMVKHPQGSYVVNPLLSLEVATPENKVINIAVTRMQDNPPQKAGLSWRQLTLHESPHTSRRFALGASTQCLSGR